MVALVTAALWEFFKHTSFQSSTHHLTLAHTTATGGVTLTKTTLIDEPRQTPHFYPTAGLCLPLLVERLITPTLRSRTQDAKKKKTLHIIVVVLNNKKSDSSMFTCKSIRESHSVQVQHVQ